MCSNLRRWQPRTKALRAGAGAQQADWCRARVGAANFAAVLQRQLFGGLQWQWLALGRDQSGGFGGVWAGS